MSELPTEPDARSTAVDRDRSAWIRPVLTVASVVVPLTCAVAAFVEQSAANDAARWTGAALAGMFVAWNLAMAGPMDRHQDCGRVGWTVIYLPIAYALAAGMILVNPAFFFVVFILYWRTFATFPLVLAIPSSIVLTGGLLLLQLHWAGGESLSENPGAVISALMSIVFGVVMAVWIGGIVDQSHRRAELIAELEATRSELAAAHHEAGVSAERQRLAHEIHDTLAEGFSSIVMLSQAAEAAIEVEPETARSQLHSIERTARENLAEARQLVEGMGPAALVDGSLVDALERLAASLAGDLGIDATTWVIGAVRPLAPAVEVALLRAAQEAVANVRKHANAGVATITIDYGGTTGEAIAPERTGVGAEEVTLEVKDDGRGFEPAAVHAGHGLPGLRARVRDAGGIIDVDSTVGEGTILKVQLS